MKLSNAYTADPTNSLDSVPLMWSLESSQNKWKLRTGGKTFPLSDVEMSQLCRSFSADYKQNIIPSSGWKNSF